MKHFLILIFFLLESCAILKNKTVDPFLGNYDIIVKDIDGVGDVPASLKISEDKNGYVSKIVYEIDGIKNDMNIISSYVIEDTTFIIESLIDGSRIDIELYFEKDFIEGIGAGIYEIEVNRINQ